MLNLIPALSASAWIEANFARAASADVSGRTQTNSSPPYLVTRSWPRRPDLSKDARPRSNSSPALCPFLSLACLRPSRSTKATVSGAFVRRAREISRSSAAIPAARLNVPVSSSNAALSRSLNNPSVPSETSSRGLIPSSWAIASRTCACRARLASAQVRPNTSNQIPKSSGKATNAPNSAASRGDAKVMPSNGSWIPWAGQPPPDGLPPPRPEPGPAPSVPGPPGTLPGGDGVTPEDGEGLGPKDTGNEGVATGKAGVETGRDVVGTVRGLGVISAGGDGEGRRGGLGVTRTGRVGVGSTDGEGRVIAATEPGSCRYTAADAGIARPTPVSATPRMDKAAR